MLWIRRNINWLICFAVVQEAIIKCLILEVLLIEALSKIVGYLCLSCANWLDKKHLITDFSKKFITIIFNKYF